tara:strand:- start:91 stop:537 length:447 start_codon:yes stop_codon:yes gene_type:complete
MSTQYLNSSTPQPSIAINNISLDKYSRPARLFNQGTSPTTNVDAAGYHTIVIQTMPLVTLFGEETRFNVLNLGESARTAWTTGDIVKCEIQTYSGFDGVPIVSCEKTNTGTYLVKISNLTKTGSPVAARSLNGFCQISIELIKFDGLP